MDKNSKAFRVSRGMYIGEAAFEYLIALLVQGTFLARLTESLGFSDSLTGIISSFTTLGFLFQLLSILIRRRRVKRLVVGISIANQILFTLLYVVPVTPLPSGAKAAAFIVCLFAAYIIYYLANPKKMNWLMSLVEDGKRGRFTANKEIVSLLSGIIFTYAMGEMSDYFKAKGELSTAFILTAVIMVVITVLHTITMLFSVEPEMEEKSERRDLLGSMASLIKDRNVQKIVGIYVIWYLASSLSTHFYGTYMNGELKFSLAFASILSSAGSVLRILVSRPMGRYADKHSFAAAMRICFAAAAVCFVCVAFATPSTGKVMFLLYYLFHSFAMAGINGGLTNLIFDYMPPEKRADSLAVCQSIAGIVGFLTTLAASALVARIQNNGNTFLSMHVYAQQVVSVFSAILCVAAVIYVSKVFLKKKEQ